MKTKLRCKKSCGALFDAPMLFDAVPDENTNGLSTAVFSKELRLCHRHHLAIGPGSPPTQ